MNLMKKKNGDEFDKTINMNLDMSKQCHLNYFFSSFLFLSLFETRWSLCVALVAMILISQPAGDSFFLGSRAYMCM